MATNTNIQIVISAVDKASSTLKGVGNNLNGAGKNFTQFGVAAGLAAAATVAATAKIVSTAYDLAETAAKYNSSRDAFNSMTKGMNLNADQLVASMAKASGGTIDNLMLLQQSVRASTLIGKNAFSDFGGQMAEIASLSKRASRATGYDVSYVFESIITGIGRQSQLLLDNAGIMIDVTAVKEKYAASLGKEAAQLTQSEEKTALLNAVIAKLQENYGNVALSAGGLSGASQQMGVAFTNLKLAIGSVLEPAFVPLVKYITDLAVTYGPMLVAFIQRLVTIWQTMPPQLQLVVIAFVAIVAGIAALAIVIGLVMPALTMLFTIFTTGIAVIGSVIALAFSPLILVIGAIIAVIALLYLAWQNNFLGIQQIVQNAINFIMDLIYGFGVLILAVINLTLAILSNIFGTRFMTIQEIVKAFVAAAISLWNSFKQNLLTVQATLNQVIAFFASLGGQIRTAIGDLWGQIKGPFEAAYKKIMEWVDKCKSAIKKVAFNTKGSPSINDEIERGLRDAGALFNKYSDITAPVSANLPNTGYAVGGSSTGLAATPAGGGVTFNVHIGMYAGSEIEKRSVAEELYKSLVTIASSKNKTVAEYLGA